MVLPASFDAIPEELRPSTVQHNAWGQWIAPELGIDGHGYFSGWCPLHDADGHDPDTVSAKFRFATSTYKCLALPPCHTPKSASTLDNLAVQMIVDGVDSRGPNYLSGVKIERAERKRQSREEWKRTREEQRKSKLAEAQAKYGPQSVKPRTDAE